MSKRTNLDQRLSFRVPSDTIARARRVAAERARISGVECELSCLLRSALDRGLSSFDSDEPPKAA